ncbi:hypothetical protein K439DRAFT_188396 [Ramaria rubella]|nr:hypothetical protein K439DRAFT_188396 [Ramaria rubella]
MFARKHCQIHPRNMSSPRDVGELQLPVGSTHSLQSITRCIKWLGSIIGPRRPARALGLVYREHSFNSEIGICGDTVNSLPFPVERIRMSEALEPQHLLPVYTAPGRPTDNDLIFCGDAPPPYSCAPPCHGCVEPNRSRGGLTAASIPP